MTTTATLVLDFDGTLCLGNEPVLDYARQLTARLDNEAAAEFMRELTAFLNGKPTSASTFDALDPYHVVKILSREAGIADAERDEAFEQVRENLGYGKYNMSVPAKFDQLIFSLPREVEVVLMTNAPETGMAGILDHLRLDGLFDEVITGARKPTGLEEVLDTRLESRQPSSILSIGDIPKNDLAPAAERGCVTGYIDHFSRPWSKATVSANDLTELYRFIDEWAIKATS